MKTITLEDLQPWENPGDGWYNIERWGEHPQQTADGKKYVQVIDDEAVRAIVEAGVPEEGLLTDVEHVSVAVTGPRDSRAFSRIFCRKRFETGSIGRILYCFGRLYPDWRF